MKTFNWRKSTVLRKSDAYLKKIPRYIEKIKANDGDYSRIPPVIVNSFPKSGTHLLSQILEGFPNRKNYGTFIASMPSITFKVRSRSSTVRRIKSIVPGELVSAHMFFNDLYNDKLKEKNAVHFFIYRDPRDVVVSESYYLTNMNKFHRLHPYFKKLSSSEERIMFSIEGSNDPDFPYYYPDVAERFNDYRGWLDADNVFSVKFEQLISEHKPEIITKMIDFYLDHTKINYDKKVFLYRALENIDPKKSHTFRKGQSGGWNEVFTEEHKKQMKKVAGDLLIELGYEKDLNW